MHFDNDIEYDQQDLTYLSWTKTRQSSGTAGSFLKSYDDTGDRKIYYKLSDYDIIHGIVGHECINEIIAGRIMRFFHMDHLEYTLVNSKIIIDGKEIETYLCKSYDFKEKGESKIPLEDYYVMERKENETPMDFCKRMNWEDIIFGMLVVDFLIINRDRHGANIEVLLNQKNKTIRLAPLFDQGFSLICRCHDESEIAEFDAMSDVKVQSFFGSNSAFENIRIVPVEYLKKLPDIGKEIDNILEGFETVIGRKYIEKIREILTRRWTFIDNLRNT